MSKKKNWHVAILRGARHELEMSPVYHTLRGVCSAVHVTTNAYVDRYPRSAANIHHARSSVINRITELLEGYAWLNSWLRFRLDGVEPNDHPEQLRATRLAWIDDMIKYWENKQ
jgi:hypothetical protein